MDSYKHKVMATLRADGSPRVSGTEVEFLLGEAWIGSMSDARKVDDLRRDPRVAIHSAPGDPEMRGGDAKLNAIALEVVDPDVKQSFLEARGGDPGEIPESFHLYRLDVVELVHTALGDPPDHLVVRSWSIRDGDKRIERR